MKIYKLRLYLLQFILYVKGYVLEDNVTAVTVLYFIRILKK